VMSSQTVSVMEACACCGEQVFGVKTDPLKIGKINEGRARFRKLSGGSQERVRTKVEKNFPPPPGNAWGDGLSDMHLAVCQKCNKKQRRKEKKVRKKEQEKAAASQPGVAGAAGAAAGQPGVVGAAADVAPAAASSSPPVSPVKDEVFWEQECDRDYMARKEEEHDRCLQELQDQHAQCLEDKFLEDVEREDAQTAALVDQREQEAPSETLDGLANRLLGMSDHDAILAALSHFDRDTLQELCFHVTGKRVRGAAPRL
jgi:hypothetical protein